MSASGLCIAVTGASGFIGSAVIAELREHGYLVREWSRSSNTYRFDLEAYDEPGIVDMWRENLRGVDVVVHTAARVHQLEEKQPDIALYLRCNALAVAALAVAADAAGVGKFIFLSSAKVYGEGCARAYRESMPPNPVGAYAESKYRAEQLLTEGFEKKPMSVVILRPPLVYGCGVGGNFLLLQKLARSPWPLPLKSLRNQRAMIALGNLVDITVRCCEAESMGSGIFNIADAHAYTLADVISAIRESDARSTALWATPYPLLKWVLTALRGPEDAQRLLGSFLLDTSLVQDVLQWRPTWNIHEVMRHLRTSSVP